MAALGLCIHHNELHALSNAHRDVQTYIHGVSRQLHQPLHKAPRPPPPNICPTQTLAAAAQTNTECCTAHAEQQTHVQYHMRVATAMQTIEKKPTKKPTRKPSNPSVHHTAVQTIKPHRRVLNAPLKTQYRAPSIHPMTALLQEPRRPTTKGLCQHGEMLPSLSALRAQLAKLQTHAALTMPLTVPQPSAPLRAHAGQARRRTLPAGPAPCVAPPRAALTRARQQTDNNTAHVNALHARLLCMVRCMPLLPTNDNNAKYAPAVPAATAAKPPTNNGTWCMVSSI